MTYEEAIMAPAAPFDESYAWTMLTKELAGKQECTVLIVPLDEPVYYQTCTVSRGTKPFDIKRRLELMPYARFLALDAYRNKCWYAGTIEDLVLCAKRWRPDNDL